MLCDYLVSNVDVVILDKGFIFDLLNVSSPFIFEVTNNQDCPRHSMVSFIKGSLGGVTPSSVYLSHIARSMSVCRSCGFLVSLSFISGTFAPFLSLLFNPLPNGAISTGCR